MQCAMLLTRFYILQCSLQINFCRNHISFMHQHSDAVFQSKRWRGGVFGAFSAHRVLHWSRAPLIKNMRAPIAALSTCPVLTCERSLAPIHAPNVQQVLKQSPPSMVNTWIPNFEGKRVHRKFSHSRKFVTQTGLVAKKYQWYGKTISAITTDWIFKI